MTKTMRAIRIHQFGGPEVLQYEINVPIPKPDSNSILIQVKAVGINPVETYIREGAYARLPKLPFIPGCDFSGVVNEVGAGVTGFKVGDNVWAGGAVSGAYSEYAVSPANLVFPLHSDVSFEQGAAISAPYRTAYRALFTQGKAKPGETVLVHGASGGVGIAAVQFAWANGMKVLGTAGSQRGMEIVSNAGAHHVFNHSDEGYIELIKAELEGSGGVDVLVENASHINLSKDLSLLAKGGRVAVVGSRGPIEINPRDIMSREAIVAGVMLFNSTNRETQEAIAAIQAGIEVGWLRPIVGREFLLEEAARAHKEILTEPALGKMIVKI